MYLFATIHLVQQIATGTNCHKQDKHLNLGDTSDYRLSTTFESRRKQATAIVMMGVLGAEFGQEMEPSKRKDKDDKRKQQAVKGFSSTDYSHARHTSEYP